MNDMNAYIRALTNPRFEWERQEALRLLRSFDEDAVVDQAGVVRWKTNGQVPPREVLEFWAYAQKPFDLEASLRALEEDVERFIQEYRRRWRPPGPEALAELRAAFGPGAVVVDVLAGRRFKV